MTNLSSDVPVVTGSQGQSYGGLVVTGSSRQPTTRHRPTRKHKTKIKTKTPKTPKVKKDPYTKLVNALAAEKYGPALAAARRQQQAVPGYFDSYRQVLHGIANGLVGNPATGQLGGVYGAAVQSTGQLGQQLANGAAQVVGAARGDQNAGAAVTGSAPSQGVLDDGARAAAVRAGMVGNFGGLIASQGATEGSYLGNQQAASGPLQIQAQTGAGNALTDLLGQTGAYKVSSRNDLKTADATAAATAEKDKLAYAIATGKDITDIKKTKITTKAARRKDNQTVNKWGFTNAEWRAMSPADRQGVIKSQSKSSSSSGGSGGSGSSSGSKGLTPYQQRQEHDKHHAAKVKRHQAFGRLSDVGLAYNTYAGHTNTVNGEVIKPTKAQIKGQLLKDGYSPTEIHLGLTIRDGKRLTPHDMELARAHGIFIPKRLRPVKVTLGKHGQSQAVTKSPGSDAAQGR